MSVTYSTNFMGPVSTKWYSDRGLTRKVSEVLKEDQKFGDLKAGDTWTYDEITTHYACGRIDIRGLDLEKYWNGWDEYSLSPMHEVSWNLLSEWLWGLETQEQLGYDELIELFESETGHKIQWWED